MTCLSAVIARSEATKQSILLLRRDGLLRGACHRARIRATRWLAMTANYNDDHCVTAHLIARRLPQLATKMNSAVQKWHTFFAQNVIARCGLLSEN
jgi:hypothetical protein